MLGLTGWAAPSRLAGPWVPCITSLTLKVVSLAFSALTLHSAYKYGVHLGSNKTEKKQRTNPQTFHPLKHRLKSRQKEAIKEQTGWHKLTRGAQARGCGGWGRGDGAAPLPRPRCTHTKQRCLPSLPRRAEPPLCLFSLPINLLLAGAAGPRAAVQVPRALPGSAQMSLCLHCPHTTTKAGTTLMQLQAKHPQSLLSSSATTSFFTAYFYSNSCKVTSHRG